MIYIFIIILCILIMTCIGLLVKEFKVVRHSHILLQRSHLKLQTSVIDIVKDLQEIHKLLEGIQADYFNYLMLKNQVDYLISEKEKEFDKPKKKSSVVKKTTKKEKKVEDK